MPENNKIRVRFAPSPTGLLHIGSARTTLFNYLFAKKYKGNFILRIEDTDKERSKKEFEKDIINGIEWLGLKWDELYYQSKRTKIYEKYLKQLLDSGKAYKKEIIWFKNPNKKVVFSDLIRDKVEVDSSVLGDFSLAKDLKTPLYNFAAVVDDHEMEISHVIRGEDHISNTPKQILLYEALGWTPPIFAHLPLILGPDRSKLSKRHGATSFTEYKNQGYLPEAMVNFMILLGWNPGNNQEIFSLKELEKEFSVEKIQKGGAVFNIEKLNWFNNYYIRQKPTKELMKLCLPYLKDKKFKIDSKKLEKIVKLEQERIKTLSEIGETVKFFFKEPNYEPKLLTWKNATREETRESLNKSYSILCDVKEQNFKALKLQQILMKNAEQFGSGDRGKLLWPLRVALSGRDKSPGPFEIADILGKKEALKRIKNAQKII